MLCERVVRTLDRLPSADRPGDGMVVYLVLLNLAQCLRTCADDLKVSSIEVKHVWTRVDAP